MLSFLRDKFYKIAFRLLLLGSLIAILSKNSHSVILNFYTHKVYTTTTIVILAALFLIYLFIKIAVFYNIFKFKLSYFISNKSKTEGSAYLHMKNAAKKNVPSLFIKSFYNNVNHASYKLFNSVKPKLSSSKYHAICKRIYKKNKDNSVAGLVYCESLIAQKKYNDAKIILVDFLDKRPSIIENSEVMYLLSSLAVKVEKETTGNLDFAQRYLDNIEEFKSIIKSIKKV